MTTQDDRFRVAVVLSGPVCAGKSSVARELVDALAAELVSARRTLIDHHPKPNPTRADLISFGAKLEEQTEGSWLAEAAERLDPHVNIVVDAVRTKNQLANLFRTRGTVIHVHISASIEVRAERFKQKSQLVEDLSFPEIASHPIEREAETLAETADLTLSSEGVTPADIAQEILERIGGASLHT